MTRGLLAYLPCPAAAYASPFSRRMTTARIIARPQSLSVVPMGNLLDINYDDWQGRSYQEVQQADPEGTRWFNAPHLAVIPGGETLLHLAGRVAETTQSIVTRHRGETVLLGGHGSVNRVLLLHALDLPLSRLWHLHQEPCAINVVTCHDSDGWRVLSLNAALHLQSLR